jgi:hypothetical protein
MGLRVRPPGNPLRRNIALRREPLQVPPRSPLPKSGLSVPNRILGLGSRSGAGRRSGPHHHLAAAEHRSHRASFGRLDQLALDWWDCTARNTERSTVRGPASDPGETRVVGSVTLLVVVHLWRRHWPAVRNRRRFRSSREVLAILNTLASRS